MYNQFTSNANFTSFSKDGFLGSINSSFLVQLDDILKKSLNPEGEIQKSSEVQEEDSIYVAEETENAADGDSALEYAVNYGAYNPFAEFEISGGVDEPVGENASFAEKLAYMQDVIGESNGFFIE